MAESTETQWFKIIVFISAGFFAGLFLADIIYFNRLRTGGTLTHGESTSMLWLSVILFVVAVIIFVWALIRLLVRQDVRDYASQKTTEYFSKTSGGYSLGSAPAPQTVQITQVSSTSPRPPTVAPAFGTVPPAIQQVPVPYSASVPVVTTSSVPITL